MSSSNYSPLDHVLRNMLERFRAHYRVDRLAKQRKCAADLRSAVDMLPLPAPNFTDADPEEDSDSEDSESDSASISFDEDDEEDDDDDDMSTDEDVFQPLNKKDQIRARSVQSHKRMLLVLRKAIRTMAWPKGDYVGDRVPKDWVPKRPVGPIGKSRVAIAIDEEHADDSDALEYTSKRRKTEGRQEEPTFASLPVPPSAQMSPQTPSRKARMGRKAMRMKVTWQHMDDRQLKKEGLRDWFLGKTMAMLPNWLTGKKA